MDRKLLEAPQPERTTDSPVIEQKPGGGAIEKKGTGDTQESSSSISPQKPETATGNSIIGIVIIGAIFFFIVGGYVARIGMGQLEIAATPQLSTASTSSEQKDDSWSLRGRIQHSGNPVANALVWVIAADDLGNRYSSDSVRTNKDGTFRVDSIPLTLVQTPLSKKIEQAIVYAATDGFLNTVLWRKSGERVISLGKSSVGQLQSLSTKWIWIILGAFFLSVLVGLGGPRVTHLIDIPYYLTILLAITSTSVMVGYIGSGLTIVDTAASGESLRLGFATIFHGTYTKNLPKEWLFSLTSPPAIDSVPESVVRGVGAPLWVLLLSVTGAALFMISLLIEEIRKPPKFESGDRTEVREHLKSIVQHQFFSLFAPLGGIFLYQLLVLTGIASEPLMVAIAVLGAGATLNLVLARATSLAGESLRAIQQAHKESK